MTSGQILIVSDDSQFVRSLMSRWRQEKNYPAITAVSTGAVRQVGSCGYEMIVVGPLRESAALPQGLGLDPDTVVCAIGDAERLKVVHTEHGSWVLLPEFAGWANVLFSLAAEVLRRKVAETRASEAEIANLTQRRFGLLGKSLLEARPGMVNALTSLLGNADLILLSEEPLPDHCRENVRTIHTMALRLSEIVQRLSSIENEMELSERKSHLETAEMSRAQLSKI